MSEKENLEAALSEAVKGMSATAEKLAVVGSFLGFHTDEHRTDLVAKVREIRQKLADYDAMKTRAEHAEKELEFVRRQAEAATAEKVKMEQQLSDARDLADNLERGNSALRALNVAASVQLESRRGLV